MSFNKVERRLSDEKIFTTKCKYVTYKFILSRELKNVREKYVFVHFDKRCIAQMSHEDN